MEISTFTEFDIARSGLADTTALDLRGLFDAREARDNMRELAHKAHATAHLARTRLRYAREKRATADVPGRRRPPTTQWVSTLSLAYRTKSTESWRSLEQVPVGPIPLDLSDEGMAKRTAFRESLKRVSDKFPTALMYDEDYLDAFEAREATARFGGCHRVWRLTTAWLRGHPYARHERIKDPGPKAYPLLAGLQAQIAADIASCVLEVARDPSIRLDRKSPEYTDWRKNPAFANACEVYRLVFAQVLAWLQQPGSVRPFVPKAIQVETSSVV